MYIPFRYRRYGSRGRLRPKIRPLAFVGYVRMHKVPRDIALAYSPARQVTNNIHSSCKHTHLCFESVCNKEHKGVICNMTSSSNSSQSTRLTGRVLGKNYSSFLDLSPEYQNCWTAGPYCMSIACHIWYFSYYKSYNIESWSAYRGG